MGCRAFRHPFFLFGDKYDDKKESNPDQGSDYRSCTAAAFVVRGTHYALEPAADRLQYVGYGHYRPVRWQYRTFFCFGRRRCPAFLYVFGHGLFNSRPDHRIPVCRSGKEKRTEHGHWHHVFQYSDSKCGFNRIESSAGRPAAACASCPGRG